jgi:4a-hydroxytetrahydrobiopterin dehydratase
MPAAAIDESEIAERLSGHPDWTYDGGALRRRFEFADFSEAFGFMTRVALAAERLFHHPDWSNSWNTVDIAVTNHDAGGVSDLCFELVSRIDEAAV